MEDGNVTSSGVLREISEVSRKVGQNLTATVPMLQSRKDVSAFVQLFEDSLALTPELVHVYPLFPFPTYTLRRILCKLPPSLQRVALVGHVGFEYLVRPFLSPTATIVSWENRPDLICIATCSQKQALSILSQTKPGVYVLLVTGPDLELELDPTEQATKVADGQLQCVYFFRRRSAATRPVLDYSMWIGGGALAVGLAYFFLKKETSHA